MRTLWIGDSHLEAMLPQLRAGAGARGWSGALVAHSGWSTGRWAREGGLPALAAKYTPDVLVVLLGTNDDPVSSEAVRTLIEQAGGAKVVWFGPFHSGAADAAFRDAIGGGYVSGAKLAAGLPFRAGGNVHLTADGYRQLADRVLGVVAAQVRAPLRRALWVAGAVALATGVVVVVADRRRAYAWEMPARKKRRSR